ncbi:AarF/ABC1/UbiB kinase family protein [Streptomyces sp. NBRC 109706]|uniref:ABC1 kinase family protein n=1 Tax=Streptomyces sp. NBRC 109706 TaxID=1550035 RepID=UPI000783AF54|nr:AarF/UbiB family protein [Streptomyces sp. NBRC 109706]
MTPLSTVRIEEMSFGLLIVLTVVASVFVVVLAFSVVSRRLLGIRVSPLRAACAGLAGLAAMALFRPLVREQEGVSALTGVQFALAVFAAMGALVLLEVFLPYGSWAWPLRSWRAMGGRLHRARRYSEISRIFMRHGLSGLLRGRRSWERARQPDEFGLRTARSLRLALEDCGGAFIKLGQLLSTRRDLLPPHFIDELSLLQSSVVSAPWPGVETVLREELGRPIDEVFEWVEEVPLAAASIAQVHCAKLREGPTVVVKVQRPGIRAVVERDLDIVSAIIRGLQARARATPALGLKDLGEGFARSVLEELDFRVEARNSEAVAATCGGLEPDAPVRIPRVHHEHTSARVLVQEWLEGVTLDRAAATAERAGIDPHDIAREVFSTILRQVVTAGVFHADPHPGNLLLLDDGRLGILDFGSVGRIDSSARLAIQEMLLAVSRSDPAGLHDSLISLLGARASDDEPLPNALLLERELGQFMAQHLGVGARPDTETFTAMFQILTRHRLTVPPEIAAVFRALATLKGTLGRLAPDFNMLHEAQLLTSRLLSDRLRSPHGGAREDEGPVSDLSALARSVVREGLSVLPMLRRLPRRAERVSAALEEGRLTVRVRIFADEREKRFVSELIHQMTVTLLAACTGLMGVLLVVLGGDRGPRATERLGLLPLLGYQLLVVSGILMLRALFRAMRRPGR